MRIWKRKPVWTEVHPQGLIEQRLAKLIVSVRPVEGSGVHNNRACRGEREKALVLYESLSDPERAKVPHVLRIWLRHRSEKHFGEGRTPPGSGRK